MSNMNNIENEKMLAFAKDYAELCRKHGLYLVFNDDVWLQEAGDEQDLAEVERWKMQAATPYNELSFEEKESDRKEADKFLAILFVENKKEGFAYSQALAFESLELREKFDSDAKVFNGVTFDDFELYAKIIAYKVAINLSNGFVMDKSDDPLIYN